MKRIPTIVLTVLFCLLFAVTSFADNIYIVDDDDDFVPQTTAPAEKPAETTTASRTDIGSIIGDGSSLDGYLGGLSDKIGSGLDSVLSGLGDTLNQWGSYTPAGESTTSSLNAASAGSSSRPSYSVSITAAQTTAPSQAEATTAAENTTKREAELASVLIVNQASGDSQGLSGSTLTLIVFIAAIVILVLVAVIVLVLMTRRTEYNSAVMNKSTLPSVDQPKTLSQFMNDDIGDDGFDYGNITYWDDN